MEGFRFRLQRLLDLRLAQTEHTARELGTARAAEDGATQSLAAAAAQRQEQLSSLREAPAAQPLELDAWEAVRAGYDSARRAEDAARTQLESAQDRVAVARGVFLQARREQQALDRLRQRRHGDWSAEQAAAEQAALDDSAGRGREFPGRRGTRPRRPGPPTR